jgi:hypothetical protein
MKALFILFVGLLLSFGASAQEPDFDDLKILFADGDYEKLVRQCEKYINKEETKKNPIVYLYMAKALYGIDVSGSENENFKNAFKDGMGYMGKCLKLDEDGAVQSEHEEFINEFTMACVERITNDIAAGDYQKAYSWVVKYKKITLNSAGTWFMEGACKYRNSDKGGANTAWKTANEELNKVTSIEDWLESDIAILKHGVIQTAEAMVAGRQIEKAKEILNKVAPWFEEDEDFQEAYDKIVN